MKIIKYIAVICFVLMVVFLYLLIKACDDEYIVKKGLPLVMSEDSEDAYISE